MAVKKQVRGRTAAFAKSPRHYPVHKDRRPSTFVIVDDKGEPLSASKVDSTIAQAYGDQIKRPRTGERIVLKGKIIHEFSKGGPVRDRATFSGEKSGKTFYVKVHSAGGTWKATDIRKGLYEKLEDLSKDETRGDQGPATFKRYALHSKDGALVLFERPAPESLESAPSDSIDALQQLAKLFLP